MLWMHVCLVSDLRQVLGTWTWNRAWQFALVVAELWAGHGPSMRGLWSSGGAPDARGCFSRSALGPALLCSAVAARTARAATPAFSLAHGSKLVPRLLRLSTWAGLIKLAVIRAYLLNHHIFILSLFVLSHKCHDSTQHNNTVNVWWQDSGQELTSEVRSSIDIDRHIQLWCWCNYQITHWHDLSKFEICKT